MSRWGLLLVNLGTPAAPTAAAVRRYLREFLSDPRVIDLPWLWRKLLLEVVILPFRPARSAEAYAKVWTDRGSPLLVHSQELAAKVRARLPGVQVELGMRYGEPSLAGALERLHAASTRSTPPPRPARRSRPPSARPPTGGSRRRCRSCRPSTTTRRSSTPSRRWPAP
jgi:protoheme ferro-lyase